MQFDERSWSDPISIRKREVIDLESENEKLQKELTSYKHSVIKSDEPKCKIGPKYEDKAREIAERIGSNRLLITKLKIRLEKIDEIFKTFPSGLRTWDDLIDQKQYLERKIRNPEQFVCYFDRSEKEKIAELAKERERKQAEIGAQLAIVDDCINKIRPLLFEP